ncbi:MAG: hypothetical protein ACTJF3_13470 [Glutamicibacter arilaitensis]
MASLQIGVQPWTHSVVGFDRGEWETCHVNSRVEFVLDGCGLTDLIGPDALSGYVSIFDASDIKLAAEVLMGRARLTDYFPSEGRIPLLFCSCGDPGEGVMTVRLSITKDTVTWDQWAWEHDSFPIEWLPHLPAYHFPFDGYEAALDEAGQMALEIMGTASSIIRIASPGQGIMHWLDKRKRGELACQLDLLDIEIIQPAPDLQDTDLRQLINEVQALRTALGASLSNRRYEPTREQSQQVVSSAAKILDSTEAFRLPGQTQESLEWLRDRFQSGA